MGSYPWWKCCAPDVLADPQLGDCELSTIGAWWYMLNAMHLREHAGRGAPPGTLSGKLAKLAMECRCEPGEFKAALVDLRKTGAANVDGDLGDTGALITIVSRRMQRDAERKAKEASKYQKRRGKRGENAGDYPPDSPAHQSQSQSQSSEDKSSEEDPPRPPEAGEGGGDSQDDLPGIERKMPADEIKRRWNDLADQAGLPKLNSLRGDRLANYRRREAEHPTLWDDPEGHDLQTQIPLLNANARGETPDWNGITFDWLMKNELNIQKACEGHYKDRKLEKRAAGKDPGKTTIDKMIELRSGTAEDVKKYHKRLAMYRAQKDSWGKIKPEAAAVMDALNEPHEGGKS